MPTDKVPFSFTNIHHVTVFFCKVIISFFSIFRYLVFVPEGFRQETQAETVPSLISTKPP